MKRVLLSMVLVLSSSAAFADQCMIVSRAQAQKAVGLLQHSMRTHALCELCGETKAREIDYLFLATQQVGQDQYQVLVDDKAVDLAYLYTRGQNVASQVGCATEGVSSFIRIK